MVGALDSTAGSLLPVDGLVSWLVFDVADLDGAASSNLGVGDSGAGVSSTADLDGAGAAAGFSGSVLGRTTLLSESKRPISVPGTSNLPATCGWKQGTGTDAFFCAIFSAFIGKFGSLAITSRLRPRQGTASLAYLLDGF